MAKAGNDWNRSFHGTIRREHDENGDPLVYGKIQVNDSYIYAIAHDQWELGKKLDEMVALILDYDLFDISVTNTRNDVTGFILN